MGKEQGTEEQAAMVAAVAAPAPILIVEWSGTPTRAPVWSEAASASALFFFFFLGERLPLLVCCLPEAMVSLQDLCVRVLGWALYLGPNPSYRPVATSSCPNPISSLSMAVACCHLVW